MECKIFEGDAPRVEAEFNKWAKGKALTKDVLVQSDADGAWVYIFVYYPEDMWKEPTSKKPEATKKADEK